MYCTVVCCTVLYSTIQTIVQQSTARREERRGEEKRGCCTDTDTDIRDDGDGDGDDRCSYCCYYCDADSNSMTHIEFMSYHVLYRTCACINTAV